MGKWCLQARSFIFYWIFVKLAGNQDRHKISDDFEFQPDRISHFGVTCPWGGIKFSIDIWNLQIQSTFQTLEFFVTLFLGTVRPRRLKLGTNMGSGQMYHVYWNQGAAAYSSLYFFIFPSLQFSTLKYLVTLFSGVPRRLKLGTHMDSEQMYHVYRNQTAAAYSSLYFFIFLFLQFSALKFFVTPFSELWDLKDWNLVHTWAVGRCIMCTGIRLLLLTCPFISSFSFSPIVSIEICHHTFLGNCEA